MLASWSSKPCSSWVPQRTAALLCINDRLILLCDLVATGIIYRGARAACMLEKIVVSFQSFPRTDPEDPYSLSQAVTHLSASSCAGGLQVNAAWWAKRG